VAAEHEMSDRDVTRRTRLAAERTWLAWWRTGVAVSAVGVAVGRLLPELGHHERWLFRVLGIGYALLAVALLVVGAVRQRRVELSLRRGEYDALSSPLVMILTAAGIALAALTLVLVAIRL
jgi:putative membrane protein